MRINSLLKILIIIFLTILLFTFFYRIFSQTHLDDVTPGIRCEKILLEKSDVLFVIPKFENISISENQTWCKEILALNKTLALHGVYHTYNEFSYDRSEEYLDEGIHEFYECFGFYPTIFKAPQLNISRQNKILINNKLELYGYPNQFFHKAYHCEDSGEVSNRFIDIF